MKCPPAHLASSRKEIARRLEALQKEAIELSLQCMSVEEPGASVSLGKAARDIGSAATSLRQRAMYPICDDAKGAP